MDDLHEMRVLIGSHYPIIAIEADDERRADRLLETFFAKAHLPLFKWTITDGLVRLDLVEGGRQEIKDPEGALETIKSYGFPAGFILPDFHTYLSQPLVLRLLKEISLAYDSVPRNIFLVSHAIELPDELRCFSAKYRLSLPGSDEISRVIVRVVQEWNQRNPERPLRFQREKLYSLIMLLKGLSEGEIYRLVRRAVFNHGRIDDDDLKEILRAKGEYMADRAPSLVIDFSEDRLDNLAGFRSLKSWLNKREKLVFSCPPELARDRPRGILLLGIPGCGKSITARAISGSWGVPLVGLDFGALYNKYVGESEKNLRVSLEAASAMAPCVLWMDEIEKGLASGGEDGGVSQRLLGTLLSWMSAEREVVFIVATSNDATSLPPELMRKGRFDEIFFVDLPGVEGRRDIFGIHLARRGLDPGVFQLERLAEATQGFSAAEVEQVVVAGLCSALADNEQVSTEYLLEEIAVTKPLSILRAEDILRLRNWAKNRAVSVE